MSDVKPETKNTAEELQDNLTGVARDIWLAGLGIFSTMEEEGGKMFEKLQEKGKEFEAKGESYEKDLKDKAKNLPTFSDVNKFVEEKVGLAVDKFGLNSKEDEVKDLSGKVDKLTESVELLLKKMAENEKKTPAKKAKA